MKGMVYILIATIGEVVGTTALKASDGFSKLYPSIIVIVSYGFAFYLLSLSLRTVPLGIGYAVWSGIGTALTIVIGILVWKETLSLVTLLGIFLIIAGVLLLNMKNVVTG